MARPVAYNLNPKKLENDISVVAMPEGHQGEGFFATQLNNVVGLARKNSIWPLPFATSCCGIEFMATMGSHYDLGRFGAERVGFSPRQCDLLMDNRQKNGTGGKAGLPANGRTPLGNSSWGLCKQWWNFRYIQCTAGH